jgi:hypothetical protein
MCRLPRVGAFVAKRKWWYLRIEAMVLPAVMGQHSLWIVWTDGTQDTLFGEMSDGELSLQHICSVLRGGR